jgi:hypothetical protein
MNIEGVGAAQQRRADEVEEEGGNAIGRKSRKERDDGL